MFNCQSCYRTTQPTEKQVRVVVESRPKVYYNDRKEVEGEGFETVREIRVCEPCGAKYAI